MFNEQGEKKKNLSTLNLTSFKHFTLEIAFILAAQHISRQRRQPSALKRWKWSFFINPLSSHEIPVQMRGWVCVLLSELSENLEVNNELDSPQLDDGLTLRHFLLYNGVKITQVQQKPCCMNYDFFPGLIIGGPILCLDTGQWPGLPVSHQITRMDNQYTYSHSGPRQKGFFHFLSVFHFQYSISHMR